MGIRSQFDALASRVCKTDVAIDAGGADIAITDAWTNLDNSIECTVPARPGDKLLINISYLVNTSADPKDALIVVPIIVNPTTHAEVTAPYTIVPGMYAGVTETHVTGFVIYTVAVGDIIGGEVTVDFKAKLTAAGGTGRTMEGTPIPMTTAIVNLGQ